MNDKQPDNPLHGITLEALLIQLVDQYGWPELGKIIDIRCFNHDPSIKSSLKFLKKLLGQEPVLKNYSLTINVSR
jgi:uncharacterized protein (DUF2132 family)